MDYAAIKAAIDGDPALSAAYAAIKSSTTADDTPESDAGIATIEAHFNAAVTEYVDVEARDVAAWLEFEPTGLWDITAASSRPGAKALMRIVSGASPITVFRMSNPATRTQIGVMLADLVSQGEWTQEQSDALLALAATTGPRWRVEGYGSRIGRGHLLLMRSGRAGV